MRIDGQDTLALDQVLILGRAPQPRSPFEGARVVALHDAKVSANHLAVGSDNGQAWVMDLRSTNGSYVGSDGSWSRLPAGERVPLAAGERVRLGGRIVEVMQQ